MNITTSCGTVHDTMELIYYCESATALLSSIANDEGEHESELTRAGATSRDRGAHKKPRGPELCQSPERNHERNFRKQYGKSENTTRATHITERRRGLLLASLPPHHIGLSGNSCPLLPLSSFMCPVALVVQDVSNRAEQ